MLKWRGIVLHWLGPGSGAMFRSAADAVVQVRNWHRAKGYVDIGYHYVVGPQGDIAPGRSEKEVGAHALGVNDSMLGILACTGEGDHFIGESLLMGLGLIVSQLATKYEIPLDRSRIIGHKDVPGDGGQTACPGKLHHHIPLIIDMARNMGAPEVYINGVTPIGTAMLVDGTAYVPARALADALGVAISYDKDKRRIDFTTKRK